MKQIYPHSFFISALGISKLAYSVLKKEICVYSVEFEEFSHYEYLNNFQTPINIGILFCQIMSVHSFNKI